MLVLSLHFRGFEVPFVRPHPLIVRLTNANSVRASVVADLVHGHIVDHSLVVNVDVGDRHIVNRAVVIKPLASPISALITRSEVAISVIHSAIKADVGTPIACMPHISTVTPRPVAWCPEKTRLWRHHPCPRHPVVPIGTVGPVAGGPDISINRTGWLSIGWQSRRRDCNGNENSCETGNGYSHGEQHDRETNDEIPVAHANSFDRLPSAFTPTYE